jgi:hypothetical protein
MSAAARRSAWCLRDGRADDGFGRGSRERAMAGTREELSRGAGRDGERGRAPSRCASLAARADERAKSASSEARHRARARGTPMAVSVAPKTDATIGCAEMFAGPPRDAKWDVPTASSALANPRPRFDREIALVALTSPSAAARREPGASLRVSWRPPSSAPLRRVARGARNARCTIKPREVERRLPISGTRARDVSAPRPARASRFGRRHDSAQDARRAALASRRYER